MASCETVTAVPRRIVVAAEAIEEVLDEQRNVVGALAQRRQPDGNDVQAVEEILAERAVLRHPREVGVGGRDHAHVDARGERLAEPLELALLQDPQQLGLEVRAHGPDLVEEERPLVRLLEASRARADGAGEGAADMAEELRLEQRFRAARAQLMATNRWSRRGLLW